LENNGSKLIVGIDALAERLNVSRQLVGQYIKLGMPCGRVGVKWHFHFDNVDRWLRNKLANAKYEGEADPETLEDEDKDI
jgi:phage terminase Nu1 subunit (DNA packaging protein)